MGDKPRLFILARRGYDLVRIQETEVMPAYFSLFDTGWLSGQGPRSLRPEAEGFDPPKSHHQERAAWANTSLRHHMVSGAARGHWGSPARASSK
jgi:hypothetical protein